MASRPGQMHTHITSRGLETEIFNFGFSGNGIMELSVAQYFVDIDASLIVIDCNPNMNATGIVSTNSSQKENPKKRSRHPFACRRAADG